MLTHPLRPLPDPTTTKDHPLDGKRIMAYLSRGAFLGVNVSSTAHRAYLYSLGAHPRTGQPEWSHPIQSSVFEALIRLELITIHPTTCSTFEQSYHASFRLPRLCHDAVEQGVTPHLPSLPNVTNDGTDPEDKAQHSRSTCCSQWPRL